VIERRSRHERLNPSTRSQQDFGKLSDIYSQAGGHIARNLVRNLV
jgi:hypothetical protein